MAKASNNAFPSVLLTEQDAKPSSPAAGNRRIYFKKDHKLYHVDSSGAEAELSGGGSGTLYTPPPLSGWSWDNQGTSTVDESGPGILMLLAQQSNGGRFRFRSAPVTTPYTVEAAIYLDFKGSNDSALDFGFRDSVGKIISFHLTQASLLYVIKFNSSTSVSGTYLSTPFSLYNAHPIWLRIEDTGTDLVFKWRMSPECPWQTLHTVSRTDFFASGPSQIVVGGWTHAGDSRVLLVSYLEN